jgi:hypothetical protein
MKPNITIHDAITGETIVREMTHDEYAEFEANGWANGPDLNQETPTE